MLQFNKTDTTVELILTLTENYTIVNPVLVFDFTHVLTNDVVSFTKTTDDDESDFKERYNAFTIATSVFTRIGEYHYIISELASGEILEKGKLQITKDFNFTAYNGTTNYKVYNG